MYFMQVMLFTTADLVAMVILQLTDISCLLFLPRRNLSQKRVTFYTIRIYISKAY